MGSASCEEPVEEGYEDFEDDEEFEDSAGKADLSCGGYGMSPCADGCVAPCGLGGNGLCYGDLSCPGHPNGSNSAPPAQPPSGNGSQIAPWTPWNTACQWPDGAASAAVSFSYDDSLPSQLRAASLLESHGARGTFFLVPTSGENYRFSDVGRAGHDIAGHHDCIQPSDDAAEHALQASVDIGGGNRPISFAHPCGSQSWAGPASRVGFNGARGVVGALNSRSGFLRWNTGSTTITHETSLGYVQGQVNDAVNQGAWASFHAHHVDGNAGATHDALVNHAINAPGVWVAPFSVVMDCAVRSGIAN